MIHLMSNKSNNDFIECSDDDSILVIYITTWNYQALLSNSCHGNGKAAQLPTSCNLSFQFYA